MQSVQGYDAEQGVISRTVHFISHLTRLALHDIYDRNAYSFARTLS